MHVQIKGAISPLAVLPAIAVRGFVLLRAQEKPLGSIKISMCYFISFHFIFSRRIIHLCFMCEHEFPSRLCHGFPWTRRGICRPSPSPSCLTGDTGERHSRRAESPSERSSCAPQEGVRKEPLASTFLETPRSFQAQLPRTHSLLKPGMQFSSNLNTKRCGSPPSRGV